MIDPETLDWLRETEIKEGFELAFITAETMYDLKVIRAKNLELVDMMQRWHLLYGEEYETLCKEHGIDFTIYEVE